MSPNGIGAGGGTASGGLVTQIRVHPGCGANGCGVGCIHGNIGGGGAGICGGAKSINGMWESGSAGPKPLAFNGKFGPRPSGCSR